ncbi:CLUMA_CG010647, isoform A [Clunio marinus]|uniref:CLUMA_CG010647, isoform A n=1 Tax=Clunio marinus TaxID=568069 RepID=A0A1J1IAK8_9DIPT|nr:CLUMA_CG010647, isoform A [Clunio marinus]
MCAKKTPTTPTKQNPLTGVTKSPTKKVLASKQTTKTKQHDESVAKVNSVSAIIKDTKTKSDGKKLEAESLIATSYSKKTSKAVTNETKASVSSLSNKTNAKQSQNIKDMRKVASRENSPLDITKNRKLAINGKPNKVETNECDRDKSGHNKSNQIKDNSKVNDKNDEMKSKSNEHSNKFEKSLSSSLSLPKSNGESDNVIKGTEKSNKKTGDKGKSHVSLISASKKLNKKNDDEGSKKNADKSKSLKAVKKVNKEKDTKIKISNELKNLGIEMSNSNSSLVVVIQEGITSGIKTSICEMVKTKARCCSNNSVNNQSSSPARKTSDIKVQSKANKESQERSVKEVDSKINTNNELVEKKKASDEQLKLIKIQKSVDKIVENSSNVSIIESGKSLVSGKNKISALVNAKNRIKSSNESKRAESIKKSNELEAPKPIKRKYVKKKLADVSKNNAIVNEKIDHNKSSLLAISDTKKCDIKSSLNADTKTNAKHEIVSLCKSDKVDACVSDLETSSINHKKTEVFESHKDGMNEKDFKISAKKPQEKLATPKKIVSRDSAQEKVQQNKNAKSQDNGKKIIEKSSKVPVKKQKIDEKISLQISSCESGNSSNSSDNDSEISEKTFKKPSKPTQRNLQRNKSAKQIIIKRSRVASLNAIAKVHCLYENEARSTSDAIIAKATRKSLVVESSDDEDEIGEDENENQKVDFQTKRSLRTAPGLRGIGKHWEMGSMSSEIDSDSDESHGTARDVVKWKPIKASPAKKDSKTLTKVDLKSKNQIKKVVKQSPKHKASDESQKEDESDDKKIQLKKSSPRKSSFSVKKLSGTTKRKKTKDDDKNSDKNVVTKKRMASLNASAILAANYEIENYAAKHESSSSETSESNSSGSSSEDDNEKNATEPPTMKKEKKDVKMESEESRPKSTNLVKIDTDVTITGVYVNSVSSQETICKTLKYRTAYSVTEECVVSRPPTQEPPKSYTPLSALTNMRPPGGQIPPEPCMTSPSDQYQPPPMFDPHMGPIPTYHYPPQQPPPQPSPYPSHSMPNTSSAFYPPQQVHRDPMGESI